jgi:ribosomal-protein-alanine N-acetyltransferase
MPALVAPAVPVGSLAAGPQPTLTAGGGVLLRPWSPGDARAVMDAYQDEAIQRWHVQRADSLAEAREWIAGWQGGWAAETGAHWAVADAGSGILLGRAALKHLKFSDGTADVAYWTVPAARGKGVCPRAVDAMASWALGVAGFHRLDLEHATGNTASCRVAGKAGFAAEGVRRSAWLLADGRHDVHAHARLRP